MKVFEQIGSVAKSIRLQIGWTQRRTADALGISDVHLCNIENGRSIPSERLVDSFGELWGIDLYVVAWCEQGSIEKLPSRLRAVATALKDEWRKDVSLRVQQLQQAH